jgi:hypothetical protein
MASGKAAMSSADINDLPDSDFAYIEPGGTKDDQGKTVPRSKRHFPIHDAAHVRNALARLTTSPFEAKARPKVEAAARKFGIGQPAEDAGTKQKAYSEAASNAACGARIMAELYDLLSCEADESTQAAAIKSSIASLAQWLQLEQQEIGTADDLAGDDAMAPSYSMKAREFAELKAEPMTTGQLDRWLKGEIPRRMLAIPYGGTIPQAGAPRGVDIDGEWFSERTDLYAGHKALLATRDRLVDFHHRMDPTGYMGDAILGKAVADESPEMDGLWVDLWANAGERRLRLVADLERRGAHLYGSSESAPGWRVNKATGEILTWPWIRQTISTSPQNTLAVMPSLKAILAADIPLREVGLGAVKAALVGLDDIDPDSGLTGRRLTASDQSGYGTGRDVLLSALREARLVIARAREVLPTTR